MGASTDFHTKKKISTRIAVDLIPLLPGAENGGAKLLATGLVRHLSQILPDSEFILLTSAGSHDELAILDSPNVRRLCVARRSGTRVGLPPRLSQIRIWLQESLAAILPPSVFARLKSLYRSMQHRQGLKGALDVQAIKKEIGADLLFCPLTAPFFYDPSVPTVSVIYDLQYLYYPQFFTPDSRYYRDRHFKEACRLSDRLVCISEYVRETVLANSELAPDDVVTIPIRLFNRLQRPPPQRMAAVLARMGLTESDFLLYPANSWPHKNHRMLFTAFGMYCARHPEADLKLVCTGAPDTRMGELCDAAKRMGLDARVVFPGYVQDEDFPALLESCRAVIFPSLYEGFGMPIVEAMAFGKPVMCSNVASLPEVAGDAALYFDPRKPREILSAIERIVSDSGLVDHLVRCGYDRLVTCGGPDQMAEQYLQVFRDAHDRAMLIGTRATGVE